MTYAFTALQDILEKVDKLQELSVPTTFFRKIRDIVFIYKQVLQKFNIIENSIKEINEIKLKKSKSNLNLSKNPPSSGELKTLSEKTNNSLKTQIKEVKPLLDSANQKISEILNKELKNAAGNPNEEIKNLLNETQENIRLQYKVYTDLKVKFGDETVVSFGFF